MQQVADLTFEPNERNGGRIDALLKVEQALRRPWGLSLENLIVHGSWSLELLGIPGIKASDYDLVSPASAEVGDRMAF